MKDIDFDELDKAVTSVLNQSPNENVADTSDDTAPAVAETAVTDDVPTVAPDPVETPAVETETATTDDVVDAPAVADATDEVVTAPADAPTASLAAKRRGKFMDVVHPSSDMAPGMTVAATNEEPAQRLVVAPISDDMTAAVDEIAASDDTDVDPAVVADPVEMAQTDTSAPAVTDAPVADTAAVGVPTDALPVTEVAEESPATDQQTPFISGAVVEKRPLGTFGDAEPDAPADTADASTSDDAEEPVVAAVAPATAPTQRELQSDIVQVETVTDEADHGEDAAVMAAPVISSDKTDDAHHLFDTATYHQPLAATAMGKKKAPLWLWWVIGLLVCLLAGGGVGYILYAGGF